VLAAAHALLTGPTESIARRSLWDLPLEDAGRPWTITEKDVPTAEPEGREEAYVSVLPAWDAKTHLELDDPALGFGLAADVLGLRIGRTDLSAKAVQAAVATYTASGFEAAAVTVSAFAASAARRTRPGRRRTATLHFGRPYAVVARATEIIAEPSPTEPGGPLGRAWDGLPIFSAWIADPVDA
jgi:hypothetical protein